MRLPLLTPILCLLAAGAGLLRAGTVLPAQVIHNDSDSGINSAKDYTHAVALDNTGYLEIFGVIFTTAARASGLEDRRYGWATNLPFAGETNANTSVTGGSGIDRLLRRFRYGAEPGELTLTGLQPGVTYQFRLYYRQWTAGVNRSTIITFSEGPAGGITIVDPDATAQAKYLPYRYTAAAAPENPDVALPLTVRFQRTDATAANATWHLYGFTNEVMTGVAQPPLNDDAGDATVTADNHFAVYLGYPNGFNMRCLGRDRMLDWESAEGLSVLEEAKAGEHLYVAAWDGPGSAADPQMWIGDFPGENGSRLVTSADAWEVVQAPPSSHPGGGTTLSPPAAASVQAVAGSAAWHAPVALAKTSAPWGSNTALQAAFDGSGAQFLWGDTFDNVSSSNTNNSYFLFRTKKPVRKGTGIYLDTTIFSAGVQEGERVAQLFATDPAFTETYTFQVSSPTADFSVSGDLPGSRSRTILTEPFSR